MQQAIDEVQATAINANVEISPWRAKHYPPATKTVRHGSCEVPYCPWLSRQFHPLFPTTDFRCHLRRPDGESRARLHPPRYRLRVGYGQTTFMNGLRITTNTLHATHFANPVESLRKMPGFPYINAPVKPFDPVVTQIWHPHLKRTRNIVNCSPSKKPY